VLEKKDKNQPLENDHIIEMSLPALVSLGLRLPVTQEKINLYLDEPL
jgi:hypothetical protein